MKLTKFITVGILVTLMAVAYVHQRVEIVKAGYNLQNNRQRLSRLVDRNSRLMYNLSKLESPRSLLTSLNGEEIEFANHRIKQEGGYRPALSESWSDFPGEGLIGRFLDIFTLSAEARPRE